MPRAVPEIDGSADAERVRIMLGLLQSVETDGQQTQRRLASELGIALGLVNAYLRRCVSKGLLKVSKIPARRYSYYLTRRGFVEKSRLTVQYLSHSFELFRCARTEYRELFRMAAERDLKRIALVGAGELAEIATLCAMESGAEVAAIIDLEGKLQTLVGRPVLPSLDQAPDDVDAVAITDIRMPREAYAACLARFAPDRIFSPPLLGPVGGNGK